MSLVPVHQAWDAWGSSGVSTQVLRPTLSRTQWGTAQEAWGESRNMPIEAWPPSSRVCSVQLGWTWPHGQGQRETRGSFLSHSLTVIAAIRGRQPEDNDGKGETAASPATSMSREKMGRGSCRGGAGVFVRAFFLSPDTQDTELALAFHCLGTGPVSATL